MRKIFYVWVCSILSLWSVANATENAPVGSALEGLKQGGYVIFFRHGATDQNHADTDKSNLGNCAAQRNLTEQGKAQAAAIGAGFKALNIPVGDVRSSEYCRCLDTAKIAFGRAEADSNLSSFLDVPPAVQQQRVQAIKTLLTTPPPKGSNTIVVSHKIMFNKATGLTLEEGEAAVFKPEGGTYKLIGQVKPEQWQQLSLSQAETAP